MIFWHEVLIESFDYYLNFYNILDLFDIYQNSFIEFDIYY